MKITVTFDTDLPDDHRAYEQFKQSANVLYVLSEYTAWLRAQRKYNDKNEFDPAWDELWRLAKEYNVDLYEV
jgi:hypothetical protein